MSREFFNVETDFNEIKIKLEKLPEKVLRNLERRAMRKALKSLKNETQRRAPIGEPKSAGEPHIKDNITTSVSAKRGLVIGKVKVKAPHTHLVEFGHRLVKGTEQIGTVPPHPFMRPALKTTAEQIVKDLTNAVLEELEKAGNSGTS